MHSADFLISLCCVFRSALRFQNKRLVLPK